MGRDDCRSINPSPFLSTLIPFSLFYISLTLISAIALFFAWIEMTLMLGRRPSIGKYTYMSIQVNFKLECLSR